VQNHRRLDSASRHDRVSQFNNLKEI